MRRAIPVGPSISCSKGFNKAQKAESFYTMPKNNKNGRKNAKNNNNNNNVDVQSVQQTALAPGAFNARVRRDMLLRPLTMAVGVTKPPKNFLSKIWWVQEFNTQTIGISGTGSVIEANQAFSLNSFADASSYQAIFDQFFIYSATVSVSCPQLSLAAATAPTGKRGILYTAIDFDSAGNLTTAARIQEYGTCEALEITDGATVTRFVKPCTTVTTTSGLATGRVWLDCANSLAQPWFGIRLMTASGSLAASYTLDIRVGLIIGFRNNI